MPAMTDEITVYDEGYPTRRLLELIGDKWTPIILYILGQVTKRYGELRRHLPDVSKKMLTQTLRALERDGLLNARCMSKYRRE
jgi:DNA-binding HxlR family transcriptional regulator